MTVIGMEFFVRSWRDWRLSLVVLGWGLALDATSGCRPVLDLSFGREVR